MRMGAIVSSGARVLCSRQTNVSVSTSLVDLNVCGYLRLAMKATTVPAAF